MKNKVVLLVGVPGSGKTWVTSQLADQYTHVAHDDYRGKDYWPAILKADVASDKPLLIETPFSISDLKSKLEAAKASYELVFVDNDPKIISERYTRREGKPYPGGNLTRLMTFRDRAKESNSFIGTSDAVLAHLKG